MRKFLARLLIAMLILPQFMLVNPSAQGAPASISVGGNPEFSVERQIARGTLDSLVGTVPDSAVLLNQVELAPGWEYILSRGAITGTTTDSVKVALRMDVLDPNDAAVVLFSTYVDSFTALVGEQISLPVGKTIVGGKYTLKALSYTGAGNKIKLNRLILWKRRATLEK